MQSSTAAFCRLSALLVPLLVAGCVTVGPDYVPPEEETPDVWQQELLRGLQPGEGNMTTWWTQLGDPQLDSLIARAQEGNLDLRSALARIAGARGFRGVSASERFPDIDGTGDLTRGRESQDIIPGARTEDRRDIGADSFWELDMWGRISRSIEAADASLEASIEDYRDVLVTLNAEVAFFYVEVRTLQARIAFAESNVETQSGSLQLTIDRRDAGLGSDLDVSQAELNLATTESVIPTLRIDLARAIHQLGVLLGETPDTLYPELQDSKPIPGPPESVMVGVPANIIRQRPDIRESERALAAQTAQIGVATADLYPTFSLGGSFAISAFEGGDMFSSGSDAYFFGPSFRWNLFDGGRVRSQIDVEDARTEDALVNYEETVLFALAEVEDSMVAFVEEQIRRDSLQRSVTAARKAVELVNTLYRTGLTDFQNVLDTERSLFQQEDDLADSEGLVTQNLIDLYKALGGGW